MPRFRVTLDASWGVNLPRLAVSRRSAATYNASVIDRAIPIGRDAAGVVSASARLSVRAGRVAGKGLLIVVFLTFAAANFVYWQKTGRPVGIGMTAFEAMTAALFVSR